MVGGSRGAHRLNEIVPEAVSAWNKPIDVHHVAGVHDYEAVSHRMLKEIHATVYDLYIRWVSYQKADLLYVVRELYLYGGVYFRKPALYIPYPYVVRDHQKANDALVNRSGRPN